MIKLGYALIAILLALVPTKAQSLTCTQTLQSLIDSATAGSVLLVPACTYHETVQVNKALTLDGQGQAVIDGDNSRPQWVVIEVSNVTIQHFIMRNANSARDQGAIQTWGGLSGVVISDNTLGPTTNGFPLGIGGDTGTQILRNEIFNGGQLGILSWQDQNLLVQGNHIHGGNTAGVDPGYAAGGMKIMNGSGKIIGNEVDHNAGPGIWIDIQENGMTIQNNNVHDQAFNPIFYEVSLNGEISGNTVANSGTNLASNWGCIISSSSGDVNIHDNTCIDSFAILALLDNRTDAPPDAGHNVQIVNNNVIRVVPDPNQANPTELTRWWQWSSTGPLVPGTNGNVDSGNVSSLPVATSTPTATPVPTFTPTPTVRTCQVLVRVNGVQKWISKPTSFCTS